MEQWNQFMIQLFFKHARLCTRLINITKLAVWFCSGANHHAGWSRGHDLHIYQQKDGLKRKTKKPQLLGVRTHPYFLSSWYHFPEEKSKALKYSFHNFAQNYIMICILFHLIDEMKNKLHFMLVNKIHATATISNKWQSISLIKRYLIKVYFILSKSFLQFSFLALTK